MLLSAEVTKKVGTQGEPLHANETCELNFTTSVLGNQNKLSEETKMIIEKAISKAKLNDESKHLIESMINKLIIDSDNRLECEVLYRSLIKKMRSQKQNKNTVKKSVNSIIETINNKESINDIDTALLSYKWDKYINLGQEARLSVSGKIYNDRKTYVSDSELENNVEDIIKEMEDILEEINMMETNVKLVKSINKLGFPGFSCYSRDIQEEITSHLITKKFNSLKELAFQINTTIEKIDIAVENLVGSTAINFLKQHS